MYVFANKLWKWWEVSAYSNLCNSVFKYCCYVDSSLSYIFFSF